jgi:N,N'-diacetyllegionaminate synthase
MKKKTIIIAEAGVNHNGKFNLAKKMIIEASKFGADFIKFQTFSADGLVTKYAKKPSYSINKKKQFQHEMLKHLELKKKNFNKLKIICKKNKIGFLSSAFDIENLKFLNKLKLEFFKVPSGEINNVPYLRQLAKFKKKIILSTGMSNLKEISFALNILKKGGVKNKDIFLLQCNTDYPSPLIDANLNVINLYKKKFNTQVGYSDHTSGIEASIAAVALGAKVIEKHFTLNKNFSGPDHKASLDAEEFRQLVKSIRKVEISLGKNYKNITPSEKKNIRLIRKSLVANTNIKKGEVFNENNLTCKRPGTGKPPSLWDNYFGKKAKKDYIKDQLI